MGIWMSTVSVILVIVCLIFRLSIHRPSPRETFDEYPRFRFDVIERSDFLWCDRGVSRNSGLSGAREHGVVLLPSQYGCMGYIFCCYSLLLVLVHSRVGPWRTGILHFHTRTTLHSLRPFSSSWMDGWLGLLSDGGLTCFGVLHASTSSDDFMSVHNRCRPGLVVDCYICHRM